MSEIESVSIGGQVWMTKNLNLAEFRNGDPILHAPSKDEWKEAWKNETPAWCYMNHDSAMGDKYGKLYNHFAVMDSRGLAPEGWHIPSDEEWTQLTDHLGKNAGHQMKSKEVRNGPGNNKCGFSALLVGMCFANGMFSNHHVSGTWHSSTPSDEPGMFYTRQVRGLSKDVGRGTGYETFGLSVRCLKD